MTKIAGVTLFFTVFLVSSLNAGVTQDTNGWTVVTPGSETKIIYVSDSEGNDSTCVSYQPTSSEVGFDPYNPTPSILPCKTISKGKSLIRDATGDWLLIKRGDTFTNQYIGGIEVRGKSIDEPLLFGTYGSHPDRPRLLTGKNNGISVFNITAHNVVVQGLYFEPHTRTSSDNPVGIEWKGDSENILIEDCYIYGYNENLQVKGAGSAVPNPSIRNFSLRRNIIFNAWAIGNHSQGLFASVVHGLLIEENIFDHNGWHDTIPGAEDLDLHNHNMYITGEGIYDVRIRGNIITRGSSKGVKLQPFHGSHEVTGNLFVNNEEGIQGGGGRPQKDTLTGINITITDNVILNNKGKGTAIPMSNINSGLVARNIIAHKLPTASNNIGIRLRDGYADTEGIGIHNTTIEDNIIYNWRGGIEVWRMASGSIDNVQIRNNIVQDLVNDGGVVAETYYTDPSEVIFSGQSYFTVRDSSEWFTVGSDEVSYSEWLTSTNEQGSTDAQVNFVEPERGTGRYMDKLKSEGKVPGSVPSTYQGFIDEVKKQSRFNWRPELMAAAVNQYIREGFQVTGGSPPPPPPPDPDPPRPSSDPLTPIARVDVVPHQRIRQGESFNFGVVAFSKARIDRVEFQISGQGYSGGIKVSREMTHNSRTDVWEYWVPISASEFSSVGPITIQATVYGKDGGVRTTDQKQDDGLDPIELVVDPTNSLPTPTVWVATSGDDSTGEVGNAEKPFATIGRALKGIEDWMSANGQGQKVDGGVVRLKPGTYQLDGGGVTSVGSEHEWLTITSDPNSGGTTENTILNERAGPTNVRLAKFEKLTIKSLGKWKYVIRRNSDYEKVWVHESRIEGPGRYHDGASNGGVRPINHSNVWSTNNFITKMGRGSLGGPLSRNAHIKEISEDAHVNHPFIINSRVEDVDPRNGTCEGQNCPHADIIQFHTAPKENNIVYGLHATDAHYQGIFSRHDTDQAPAQENMAFVNCLIELRDPAFGSSAIKNQWRHLVMWHNTFINHHFVGGIRRDGTQDFYDASVIGNVFENWRGDAENTYLGEELPWTLPGNANNNEFIHNHYATSATDHDPQGRNCRESNKCADTHFRSKSPDTEPGGVVTQSLGKNVIEEDTDSPLLGRPKIGSILIERIDQNQFPTVPADVFGNYRGQVADVGAIQFDAEIPTPPPGPGPSPNPDPSPKPDPDNPSDNHESRIVNVLNAENGYTIDFPCESEARIYNQSGDLIATLNCFGGNAIWSAEGLPSGVYFIHRPGYEQLKVVVVK